MTFGTMNRQRERIHVLRRGAKFFNPHRVERLLEEGQITWDQAWDGLILGVQCNLILSDDNSRRT